MEQMKNIIIKKRDLNFGFFVVLDQRKNINKKAKIRKEKKLHILKKGA